jgi:hypothetical protein
MHSSVKAILMVVLIATVAGCSSATGPGGSQPALAITGAVTVAVGQTSQLTLMATPPQSAAQDVTSQANWTSSTPGIATVNGSGLVTAVSYGSTTITAKYQGASTATTFAVSVAGTWSSGALDGNQNQITWTLSQTGGNVTGTVGFVPAPPAGFAFSVQSVAGPIAGTTFTWTMTLTPSLDPSKPECVGQATIFAGTAQLTSGTTMSLTLTSATTPCDSKQPGAQLKGIGSFTLTKQ